MRFADPAIAQENGKQENRLKPRFNRYQTVDPPSMVVRRLFASSFIKKGGHVTWQDESRS